MRLLNCTWPGLVNQKPLLKGLSDNAEDIDKLHEGVNLLVYGMIGWLTIITLAAIVVFVVVYARLSRAARALDDAEAGSTVSGATSKSSAKASKRSRSKQRPAPLSSRRLPSLAPPSLDSPSFLDFDFPGVSSSNSRASNLGNGVKSVRDAEIGRLRRDADKSCTATIDLGTWAWCTTRVDLLTVLTCDESNARHQWQILPYLLISRWCSIFLKVVNITNCEIKV
jgi:hypothetical protein